MNVVEQTYTILMRHLQSLDKQRIGKGEFFPTQESADRYESLLTFSYRRMAAAAYHLSSIEAMLRNIAACDGAHGAENVDGAIAQGVNARQQDDRFAYELSACLAAIRSAIDFVVQALRWHLDKVECDSVSDIFKMIKRKKRGPLIDEVAKHSVWLEQLREYRDVLGHRLVLRTSRVSEVYLDKGGMKTAAVPIVVPRATPRYAPDTRAHAGVPLPIDGAHYGVMTTRSESWVTIGNERALLKREVKHVPAADYVEITEFIRAHMAGFYDWFKDSIDRVAVEGFRRVKVEVS